MADQDAIWKEIIAENIEEFLAFFFTEIYAKIDWSKPTEFLDKELAQINPESEVGTRIADKLVKVYLLDGREAWILIHIEVQGYYDANFAERMYVYNYRIFDRYHKPVVSLALFTDESSSYRPNVYEFVLGNYKHRMEFPLVKLLDYRKDWESLENDPNPFSLVVMAHLKMRELGKDKPDELLTWKLKLFRLLLERGYTQYRIRRLMQFMGGLVRLPKEYEANFKAQAIHYEGGVLMPFISSFERTGMEKEAFKMILRQARRKFGAIEPEIEMAMDKLELEQLEELDEAMFDFKDKTELTDWLQKYSK